MSCKYCGAKAANICSNCYVKLKLIRQIKAMLKPKKEKERENKNDL